VARWTTYHVFDLVKAMKVALMHPGFAFIEIVSQCTTSYAKAVGKRTAADFLAEYKERSVRISKARKMSAEELDDRIIVGTLKQVVQPEFCERLFQLAEQVAAEA
jgi:2-oxoglutarate ferredoxin oxidoreductase subunit beta